MTFKRLLLAGALLAAGMASAADDADRARAEMQKKLNNQVMSAPFDPGDISKAEAYAAEAKAANVVPVAQPPTYWAPGWTCANLTSYAYYNYGDYRNCIYYHHYYGRYWYRR
jgi:hypothetical protein